jgi:hypothetical protein
MEQVLYSHTVHYDTLGCRKRKKDIMISFIPEGANQFNDFYLTNKQAESLMRDIYRALNTAGYISRGPWYTRLLKRLKRKKYESRFNRHHGRGSR